MTPISFGPMSAWTLMFVSVAVLALVEYLRRTFATKDGAAADAATHARERTRLEREFAARLERIERSFEKAVTQDQHKSFGERIGTVEKEVTEAKSDARNAVITGTQVSNDIKYLTKRMEDTIAGAIFELREQVKELARQQRRNGGTTP